MSGIYIPGMEMPKSCAECRFFGEYCYAKGDENKYSKLPCPLIPVPDHGRLIDADKALADNEEYYSLLGRPDGVVGSRYRCVWMSINLAPTIIPADKEGEG